MTGGQDYCQCAEKRSKGIYLLFSNMIMGPQSNLAKSCFCDLVNCNQEVDDNDYN